MGNSPTFSGPHSKHIQQAQNVLLIRTTESSDHYVSKYQHYYDNNLLQFFEFIRWKLNIALLFRPFSCLAVCTCCSYEWHQWLYRITISELIFWSMNITLSVFPITWFLSTFNETDTPIFDYNSQGVIRKDKITGQYINSPGNVYGNPTSICFVVVCALSLRNTIWNLIFGFGIERAVTIHKWMGRLSLIMAFIHFWEYRNYEWFKGQCLPGAIMFGSVVLITLTSFGILRRRIWTIFMWVHYIGFITFFVAGIVHGAKYLWIAISVFIVDILYRLYIIFGKPVKVKDIKLLPCNVIRLEFDKEKFQFNAGQYIFVCIPAIDIFQYHPFSISSAPHQKHSIMIHIRVLGDWTRKLYQFVTEKYAQNQIDNGGDIRRRKMKWDDLTVLVEGPYGTLQVPLYEYESVIMISGGIGITPLQSIFNELMHEISHNSSPRYQDKRDDWEEFVQRIHFVWSVRDPTMVTEFGKLHWAGIQHRNKKKFKFNKNSNSSYDDDINEYKHYDYEKRQYEDKLRMPNFYSPDLLLVQQGTKMVQKTKVITQFHLTRVIDEERRRKYGKTYKLLKFGRPNIEEIIKKAIEEFEEYESKLHKEYEIRSDYGTEGGCCISHTRGKGICILVCGPISMIKNVKKYASKYNIDCHVEIFEF